MSGFRNKRLGEISQLVEHHVKYIAHQSFLKYTIGVGLLTINLLGIVVAAGIGPVKIPPSATARILISHLPGLKFIGTKHISEISKEINSLKERTYKNEPYSQLSEAEIEEKITLYREKIKDWENYEVWIWQGRMPRIIISLLAGAGLAVSGAIFQGLVLNPLASSGTLGVSAGAAAGASIFIVFGTGTSSYADGVLGIPLSAFLGAMITLSLVWFVAKSGHGSTSPLSLILAGVIVGIFLSSAMSFVRIIAEEESLRSLTLWGVGSLASREWIHVKMGLPIILTGIILGVLFSRELNILSLGARHAQHIGVNVNRSRKILMVTAAMITAGAVSVAGPIGFVGLVVPHSVRMLIGPDHRTLIPFCALGGGFFLLICDTVGRTMASPLELPVGIVTSLIGAPFFVYIYKTRLRTEAVVN